MSKNIIGRDPDQVPLNSHLGSMARQDANDYRLKGLRIPLTHRKRDVISYSDGGGGTLTFNENDIFMSNSIGSHQWMIGRVRVPVSGTYRILIEITASSGDQSWGGSSEFNDINCRFDIHQGTTEPNVNGYYSPRYVVLSYSAYMPNVKDEDYRETGGFLSPTSGYLHENYQYDITFSPNGWAGRRQYWVQAWLIKD